MSEDIDRDSAESGTPDAFELPPKPQPKIQLRPDEAERIIRAVDMAIWFLELQDEEDRVEDEDDAETLEQKWDEFCEEFGLDLDVRNYSSIQDTSFYLKGSLTSREIKEAMVEAYAVRRKTVEEALIKAQTSVRSIPLLGKLLSELEAIHSDLPAVEEDCDEKTQVIFRRFNEICRVLRIVPADSRVS